MKWPVNCLGFALALLVFGEAAEAREMADVFDKPVDERVILLETSHDYPNGGRISCFYYPNFMVKEVDLSEKGAAKLSILPVSAGKTPPCKLDNPEEVEIKDGRGYFGGVKGRYVFFSPDDGYSGIFVYGVFNGETQDKLFEIAVEADYVSGQDKTNIHDINVSGDTLTILYRRGIAGQCSLYDKTTDCWNTIRTELGLPANIAPPDCWKAYESDLERFSGDHSIVLKNPTMFGYEVKHIYRAGQSTIAPQPGTVTCWAAD